VLSDDRMVREPAAAASYDCLIIFSVVLSIGYGSRISEYFGRQNVGTLLGAFFTASGLSALFGPLLAGLAVDLTASYSGGIIFALATGFLGFIAIASLGRHRRPEYGAASGVE
jgi:MFS family permease